MTDEHPQGDVMVCVDCYFTHHYGCTPYSIDPAADDGPLTGPIRLDEVAAYLADGWTVLWRVSEYDEFVDLEPLHALDGYDLSDNTCSDHNSEDTVDDFGDPIIAPCTQCGRDDHDNGIHEFSRSWCDGCNSPLAGTRYRLHWRKL